MTPTLWIYLLYGGVSVGLTIWLAGTLFQNGAIFLDDVFDGNHALATAVNRMLVVGFYMLNLGYAFTILNSPAAATAAEAADVLINKLGRLLLALGAIHFANMVVFWQIRKRRMLEQAPVPVQAPAVLQTSDPYTA